MYNLSLQPTKKKILEEWSYRLIYKKSKKKSWKMKFIEYVLRTTKKKNIAVERAMNLIS